MSQVLMIIFRLFSVKYIFSTRIVFLYLIFFPGYCLVLFVFLTGAYIVFYSPSHPVSCTRTHRPFMFRGFSTLGRLLRSTAELGWKNTENPRVFSLLNLQYSIVRALLLRAIPIFHFYLPPPWSINITRRSRNPWLRSPSFW